MANTAPTMSSIQGVPDVSFLDSLIGKDAGAYLTNLTSKGTGTGTQATTPSSERVLTEDEKKFGSYGTVRDIAGTDLTDLDSVAAMAKRGGWADPNAFNLDMLTGVEQSYTGGGEGGRDPASFGFAKFKDPASRGITDTGRNLNRVHVDYAPNEDGTYYGSGVSGYKVLAGAVPGTKNHTSLYYEYDKDGKFKGASIDMEERGLEGAAPLVNMALMAMGAGGTLGTIGSSINSSLGLGLGNVGQAALGGAAVGGGAAALTGQDVVKGAAMGGIGSAVTAANPAGAIGINDPRLLKIVNTGASNLAKSAVSGKDPKDVVLDTAFAAAMPPTMTTLLNIARG